ncbi:hypothetical protein [Streptomyces sp. NRRL F-525]|uniref:hypothetical protein n=1 Tax=Streptomyces sp. NRRL F-525 TaxID=1463861 RepID=UPI00052567E0|nr:hypothetical protein [Streptomyces sp. NRRL F-525]
MPRSTWTAGRRGALLGASAAVLCATLTACGDTGDGYVAIGPPRPPSATAARPTGSVTLVPLDTPTPPEGSKSPPGEATSAPAPAPSPPTGAKSGRSSAPSPSPTPTAVPTTAPATPAALTWGDPARKATDHRWCEDVTLSFRNSGGTAVRSGTVAFGTHIIGALGIDWATIGSTERLPVPIPAHAREDHTWTVCVDAWRVPLGMHIETRDVSVEWH